ncbi:hypothetical protein D3C75_468880 [compost metagenome]
MIQDTRQQQAAFQHRDLLFNVAFGLQSTIQPVFDLDVLLNQGVAVFCRRNQTLAKLMVNVQLLLHQWILLNTRGFVRVNGLLRGFLRQGKPLAVDRFLQQLQLVLKAVDIGGDIIALFLQGILQHRIAFQALTLLVNLRVEQQLLSEQERLLGRAQGGFARRGAIQAVTDLLQLLRRGVHRILHALGLRLQRDQLAVVGRKIALCVLQIIQHLRHPRFELA